VTATILTFPIHAASRLLSTVSLLRLDGTLFTSKDFLPGDPGAAWAWICKTVAAELECAESEVHAGDDAVCVEGLPVYIVEIVRPTRFMC
jgi:hypothetical protein